MPRSRSRYRSYVRTKTSVKTSTGLTFELNTNGDVVFETMQDGSFPKGPAPRRPTLSDSVRSQKKRAVYYRKWKFHTMQYSSSSRSEALCALKGADLTNGSRKWTGYGHLGQWFTSRLYPAGLPSWPSVSLNVGGAHAVATSKALNYLDRPKLTLGEPIGELRNLPRDLNPVLRVLQRDTGFFRKKVDQALRKGALGKAKIVADIWASYAFAIGPMVRTANDICSEYASRIDAIDPWQTARGKSVIKSDVGVKLTPGSGSGWTWTLEQVRFQEYDVRYGIVFMANDRVSSVPGRLGLVPRDWPSTAWELFPLSFIVDRVINVKRFIRTSMALSSPSVKISPDSYCVERFKDVRLVRVCNYRSSANGVFMSPDTTPYFRQEDFSYSRYRWKPGLGDAVTTIRGDGLFGSLTKTLDVASIILGRISI